MIKLHRVLLITAFIFIIFVYPWCKVCAIIEGSESINQYNFKNIRIGLFFNDQAKNKYSALAYFNASAREGLEIGFYNGEKFKPLISVEEETKITIIKDSYFILKNGSFIEYNPNGMEKNIEEEKRIGPFHVSITDNCPDYNSAKIQSDNIKEKGINAYPVYNNGLWGIWSGFFISEDAALKHIDKLMDEELLYETFKVVAPNPNSIVVTFNFDEVLAIFTSDDERFQIRPKDKNNPYMLNIDDKNYRGIIEVNRINSSDLTVINELPLEEYLYGVIPCEIGWTINPEALKAQAIVARTYAYGNLGKYANLGFDLCTTVSSQVYKGFDFEKNETNKVVDETFDKAIYYDDNIAQVFYFSSSGGQTEAAENVWSSNIPYLKSVEDNYEEGDSYNYNWEKKFSANDIKEIIESQGSPIGNILGINISNISEAGRVIEMVILGDKKNLVVKNAKTREVLGLPSQWYNITSNGDIPVWDNIRKSTTNLNLSGKKAITDKGIKTLDLTKNTYLMLSKDTTVKAGGVPITYTFTGKGYGHAVGMSQAGAKGMADAGFTFEEILSHYFVGTYVESTYAKTYIKQEER